MTSALSLRKSFLAFTTKSRIRKFGKRKNIAKGSDIFVIFADLSVTKCDKIAAISEEDADTIMLSYANACREKDPEMVIKKTYEFTSSKNADVSTHGFIINTRDFIFKKMEDVQ